MAERKGVFVYVDIPLHDELKAHAAEQERSISWVVKDAIRRLLHPEPVVDHGKTVGFGNDFPKEPIKRKSRPTTACSHPLANRSKGKCLACGAEV